MSTETFKRVYVNGDEKNLPEIGTETIYFKPYVGIYTGQYLEEDKRTWLKDVAWYLFPVQHEEQGKEIITAQERLIEYLFQEYHGRFATDKRLMALVDNLNKAKVDQPKEQPFQDSQSENKSQIKKANNMKVSEVIKSLQESHSVYGDLPLTISIETGASDLLHQFFNSKSDANKYLTAEQQEELESYFVKYCDENGLNVRSSEVLYFGYDQFSEKSDEINIRSFPY